MKNLREAKKEVDETMTRLLDGVLKSKMRLLRFAIAICDCDSSFEIRVDSCNRVAFLVIARFRDQHS